MENGFKTFAEVISFAVMREEESHEFYKHLAEKATDPFIKTLFSDFAKDELRHKQVLLDLETGSLEKMLNEILEKRDGLGMAGNMEIAAPDPNMTFGNSLRFAMNREDKAFELYSLLAEISEDDDISILFLGLAKEEEQHFIKIEKTYKSLFDE